ncbi:MAG: GNAT family N-acetyltransferase [Candidatus Pacebacteria bacterium]|nr:GNAT family N-acetyltransferase [Candidatus Paceibacterota bacterium]
MKIRKAKKEDILSILKLVEKMVDFHYAIDKIYKPYKEYKELEKYFKSLINTKDNILVVVENENKIIGFLEGGIEKASNDVMFDKIGTINNIFIEEKFRNKGIAKKLLKYIFEYFKSKNIEYIQISTDARNKVGKEFWKKNNFFEYQIKMLRKLK